MVCSVLKSFCNSCKLPVDILEILLHQSAEVVEYLHEEHVKAIANLLNTFGREGKVRKTRILHTMYLITYSAYKLDGNIVIRNCELTSSGHHTPSHTFNRTAVCILCFKFSTVGSSLYVHLKEHMYLLSCDNVH